MKILIASIFLFTQVSWAACQEDVQLIRKNEVANCTGYLYSPGADEKANDVFEERDYLKDTNDLLTKKNNIILSQNEILERRLELHIKQGDILAKQLVRKENQVYCNKTIYFTLGILATGLAVKSVQQF